jgi:tetratricopeptide (TPR) repeat protein
MRLRLPLFALFCVFAVFASPITAHAKDEWISVRSKNFNLIGNASDKEIRGVAQKLEQFRETFRLLFPGVRLNTPIQTNVVVFKSASSYKPFKPKMANGKADTGIAGYFQAGEDVNYITLSTEGGRDDMYGTIFHEYVHFIINTNFGQSTVPPWFNEGLAEFYQVFRIEEDQKVYLGELQNEHLLRLQQTKLIPLKDFFSVTNYSLHTNGNHSRGIFYAQAWAMIHYLMLNREIKPGALSEFSSLVMKNVEPEKAFRQAVGMDYAAMEKALKRYVDQRSFSGVLFTLKNKLVFDSEMTSEPLGEAQANAYLGDLLYHTHEYADAEIYLEKALSLDPKLSMANTSLGLVRMRQRKFDEAERYLERAIADDQKNHFAHYNYAQVLSRKSMDEFGYVSAFPDAELEKMQRSLKRAIEINPEFAESYRLLAFVNLISVKNLDESLAMLRKGLAIQPGNQSYSLLIAQIFLRQQKFDEAKGLAEKIAATAPEASMRANAQNILASIKQYSDAKAEYDKQVSEFTARGNTMPKLIRRDTISDEEMAKLDREREIRNLNVVVEKPLEGEKQIMGRIEKIECANGTVRFSVRGEKEPMILTSKDFQSLRVMILHEGTINLEVGCNATIEKELAVIGYRPAEPVVQGIAGVLVALTFVPSDFRFMTDAEMKEPATFVTGGPPTDLAKNEELIAAEKIDFEKKRREFMFKQIEQNLRQPESGETRSIGVVKKVICSSKTMLALVALNGHEMQLRMPEPKSLRIMSFTQEAAGIQFGCNVSIPDLTAVISYIPITGNKKIAGDLKAIEFVPKTFQLP